MPWTILRATQFHEFAEQALGIARIGPLSLVPQMLSQPVAAAEVADHLVALAERPPSAMAPEIAGPEQLMMPEMARRLVRSRGLRRRVIGLRLPGAAGRAMRDGTLTPVADGPRGRQTYDEWLAAG
ncbi:Rossmann-fold NAD(P)-binding domain-containing protein [Nocardioides sambongensis]|uniref:hypothetical protein n=1 Tax=Nocardioides sambongensis TaxID=2589074 RepID=UPI0018C8BCE8|nr:hypothetical protein [Nocardioides sambongensis]